MKDRRRNFLQNPWRMENTSEKYCIQSNLKRAFTKLLLTRSAQIQISVTTLQWLRNFETENVSQALLNRMGVGFS